MLCNNIRSHAIFIIPSDIGTIFLPSSQMKKVRLQLSTQVQTTSKWLSDDQREPSLGSQWSHVPPSGTTCCGWVNFHEAAPGLQENHQKSFKNHLVTYQSNVKLFPLACTALINTETVRSSSLSQRGQWGSEWVHHIQSLMLVTWGLTASWLICILHPFLTFIPESFLTLTTFWSLFYIRIY